jgi:hypothetical protein
MWWALMDSNHRPTDYESAALTAVLRALTLTRSLNLSLAEDALCSDGRRYDNWHSGRGGLLQL